MAAISFDTLALARKREQAGFPATQDTAAALADVMGAAQSVTQDFPELKLRDLEQRLIVKPGAMYAASVVAVATPVKPL